MSHDLADSIERGTGLSINAKEENIHKSYFIQTFKIMKHLVCTCIHFEWEKIISVLGKYQTFPAYYSIFLESHLSQEQPNSIKNKQTNILD